MNKPLRRTLTFLSMVAVGLLVIALLSEEGLKTPSRTAHGGSDDLGGVKVRDPNRNSSGNVVLGEMTFEVMEEVELPDGSFAERAVYRVHIMGGQPAADGRFVVDLPTITFLDVQNGEPRGSLRAELGLFDTPGGLDASFVLDQSQLDIRSLTLEHNVIGELPLGEGGEVAQLQAERLDVRGEDVHGPGLVSWSRPGLALSGSDMHWSGAARLLTYEADAELRATAANGSVAVLAAPGGLSWELPEGGRGRGRLYGPVSGEDDLGSSLSCDELRADVDQGLLELVGEARLRQHDASGTRRFGARRLEIARDPGGAMRLLRAEGGVRATMTDAAGAETSFATEEIQRLDADRLGAPGELSWQRVGALVRGRGLVYTESSGRVEMAHDVQLITDHDAPEAWRGADLASPAGLVWDAEAFVLRGPVRGGFAGRNELSADLLAGSMVHGELHLLGDARLLQYRPDGGEDELIADAIDAWRDEDGLWSRVHARGDVQITMQARGEAPRMLRADGLERDGEQLSIVGHFEALFGPTSMSGRGLRLDEAARYLEVDADLLWMTESDTAFGKPSWLRAFDGLAWWFGPEPAPIESGYGELLDLEGVRPDGTTLEAERARIHGAGRRISLRGELQNPATIRQADGTSLTSLSLELEELASGSLVSTSERFYILNTSPDSPLSAFGDGLRWHEASGEIEIGREARLSTELTDGAQLSLGARRGMCVDLDGSPADAQPGLRGSLHDSVTITHSVLGALQTDDLFLDGPGDWVATLGPTRLERKDAGWFETRSGLLLTGISEPAGADVRAGGGVSGSWLSGEIQSRFEADSFRRQAASLQTELLGAVSLARKAPGQAISLSTGPAGRLLLREDELGGLAHVSADGEVRLTNGELVAEAARLVWDVPEDHLQLRGNCRFLAMGAWMSMERVDIWPEQMRWFVPRAEMQFTPRDQAEDDER